jgi:hypothetical protein
VTQEGLAIALASNVLQTNLNLVTRAFNGGKACHTLSEGGSAKATSIAQVSSNVVKVSLNTYYGSHCTGLYMTQQARASIGSGYSLGVTATTGYVDKAGTTLGTLVTQAQAEAQGNALELSGVGTFTSADGATKASLGLACQPAGHSTNCQGGIAQDFAALGRSLGSITPLTLGTTVSTPKKHFTFSGVKRVTSTAGLGALSITSKNHKLVLTGAATALDATTTSGQAGGFVLFPGTPTGWTVTDTAGGVVFTIAVDDNTTRTLTATVKQISTGDVLATAHLDQSGSGTITYKGSKPAPVVSWILSR